MILASVLNNINIPPGNYYVFKLDKMQDPFTREYLMFAINPGTLLYPGIYKASSKSEIYVKSSSLSTLRVIARLDNNYVMEMYFRL